MLEQELREISLPLTGNQAEVVRQTDSMTILKRKLLIIAKEPAPYDYDLFNAFSDDIKWDTFVFFTQQRDWGCTKGHNFIELPEARFKYEVARGRPFQSLIMSAIKLARLFYETCPDFTIVKGYNSVLSISALTMCILSNRPFALFGDWFNNSESSGIKRIKNVLRDALRAIIFRKATAILTCGKEGVRSAIEAGCLSTKVVNFPYAVDRSRLSNFSANDLPAVCEFDLESDKTIIMFSGRLIQRKGLSTLLDSLARLQDLSGWVTWIEGDGPLESNYKEAVKILGIESRCRFLGFCQMSLHSKLLQSSDIVVVPSFHDPWGIVVDEAMQLGKAVCASRQTKSAMDRIDNRVNGYLFEAGSCGDLTLCLSELIQDPQLRSRLGNSASESSATWSPQRNVVLLNQIFERLSQPPRVKNGL